MLVRTGAIEQPATGAEAQAPLQLKSSVGEQP